MFWVVAPVLHKYVKPAGRAGPLRVALPPWHIVWLATVKGPSIPKLVL